MHACAFSREHRGVMDCLTQRQVQRVYYPGLKKPGHEIACRQQRVWCDAGFRNGGRQPPSRFLGAHLLSRRVPEMASSHQLRGHAGMEESARAGGHQRRPATPVVGIEDHGSHCRPQRGSRTRGLSQHRIKAAARVVNDFPGAGPRSTPDAMACATAASTSSLLFEAQE